MTGTRKVVLVIFGVTAGCILVAAGFLATLYFGMITTVMTKVSPDGHHTARLLRWDGIDVNYQVSVDGHRVYNTPDFAPVPADFREQLVWSATSDAVVLDVAGQRIFGYHIREGRPLTDAELRDVRYTPFEELGFEGPSPSK